MQTTETKGPQLARPGPIGLPGWSARPGSPTG
jgi:hypothetical protein